MSRTPWAPYYPFTGRVLDIGGHQMHFLDEGKGETVVMVHGNPTWSFYFPGSTWRGTRERIAGRIDAVLARRVVDEA